MSEQLNLPEPTNPAETYQPVDLEERLGPLPEPATEAEDPQERLRRRLGDLPNQNGNDEPQNNG